MRCGALLPGRLDQPIEFERALDRPNMASRVCLRATTLGSRATAQRLTEQPDRVAFENLEVGGVGQDRCSAAQPSCCLAPPSHRCPPLDGITPRLKHPGLGRLQHLVGRGPTRSARSSSNQSRTLGS